MSYTEQAFRILDRKDEILRTKTITLVKVPWDHHSQEKATWEPEEEMRERYHDICKD